MGLHAHRLAAKILSNRRELSKRGTFFLQIEFGEG
jgi:hypothetical protein